jgi:hypothetical protein
MSDVTRDAIIRYLRVKRRFNPQDVEHILKDVDTVLGELQGHPEGILMYEVEMVTHRSHASAKSLVRAMADHQMVRVVRAGKTTRVVSY